MVKILWVSELKLRVNTLTTYILCLIRWNICFGKTEQKVYSVIFQLLWSILHFVIWFCKRMFLSGYLAGFVSRTWQPWPPPYELFVFLPPRAHACVPPVCLTCLCPGVAILLLAWLTSAEYHSQISLRHIQRARICVSFLFLPFPPSVATVLEFN